MNKKEIEFYLKFHKGFRKNYTLNSALKSNLLLLNKKFFLVGQKKLKTYKNKTYTKVLKTFRIM